MAAESVRTGGNVCAASRDAITEAMMAPINPLSP
jgi:hypothetical protein